MHLRPGDYRAVPQAHGFWTTREIGARREEGGVGTLWRVSLARILADCAFSHLPRIDRTITLIEGDGLDLDFGADGALALHHPLVPERFRGDWPARCRLRAGPVEVLNVMTDRSRARHEATVILLDEAEQEVASGETLAGLLYCARGRVALVGTGAPPVLAAGESWLERGGLAASCRPIDGLAALLLVTIRAAEADAIS